MLDNEMIEREPVEQVGAAAMPRIVEQPIPVSGDAWCYGFRRQ